MRKKNVKTIFGKIREQICWYDVQNFWLEFLCCFDAFMHAQSLSNLAVNDNPMVFHLLVNKPVNKGNLHLRLELHGNTS